MRYLPKFIFLSSLCFLPFQSMAEQTTIRFASWDDTESLKIQQQIAQKFEEMHPEIKVQIEPYSDGYDQKITAAFGAKSPPDVLYMWDFPTYASMLEPLNSYFENDKELKLEEIPKALIHGSSISGNTYGLPAGFTTHVIFYNKDMFNEKNIEIPAQDWKWSDLIEAAHKLRDKENKVFGFAVSAKPDPFDFEQFLWSNGVSYISEDGSAIDNYMNSPQSIEVFDMFAQMIRDDIALVSDIGSAGSPKSLFTAKKLGMFEGAMWDVPALDESGIDYGVAHLPQFGDKPSQSAVNASYISMAKDSKNKEAAWKFIRYYISDEAIKMRKADLAVRERVAKELGLLEDSKIRIFYDMLAQSDKHQPAFLKHDKWSRIQENLAYAIEATFLMQGTAEDNLNTAVKKSKRFMK